MSMAFVFPGQGSQSIAMMSAYEGLPCIRETFTEASDALGEDLWALVQAGMPEQINATVNTQPLMLTADIAVWRAWCTLGGPEPTYVAGHSLGEYAALVAAGVLDFAQAVQLVRFRAQAMQAAVPVGVGAMAAVLGIALDVLSQVCQETAQGQVVEPVNLNAPGQIVIAGHHEAVERACALALQQGAKRALPLPVSAPFHCALMKPAAEAMKARLQAVVFNPPKYHVIHNFDVQAHVEPAAIRQVLINQIDHPVRWIETIQLFSLRGVTSIVECGPGKILSALTKRIDATLTSSSLHDRQAMASVLAL